MLIDGERTKYLEAQRRKQTLSIVEIETRREREIQSKSQKVGYMRTGIKLKPLP